MCASAWRIPGRTRTALLLAGVLLILASCANVSNPTQPAGKLDYPALVNRIKPDVQSLRGLTFSRPLKVKVLTREQYSQMVAADVDDNLSDEEEPLMTAELVQMGYLREGETGLTDVYTEYYSGFPQAYYIDGTDSMYFISDNHNDTILTLTVAHELTHALQDQHFTLFPPPPVMYSRYSSDWYVAQRCLIEGDAMFTEYSYYGQHYYEISDVFPIVWAIALEGKADFLTYRDTVSAPYFLSVRSASPYYLGMAFVADAHSSGGWDAINRSYGTSSRPRSTAEVMSGRTVVPQYFEFSAIQQHLVTRRDVAFLDDDNVGAVMLLALFYPKADTTLALNGMGLSGDRYLYLVERGEEWGTLAWALAFVDSSTATIVYGMLDEVLRGRSIGGSAPFAAGYRDSIDSAGRRIRTYPSTLFTSRLVQSGKQVWWIENADSSEGFILQELVRLQQVSLAKQQMSLAPFPTEKMLTPRKKRRLRDAMMGHVPKMWMPGAGIEPARPFRVTGF